MLNHEEFVAAERSLLIAPAGYGKTYTISECLKHTEGKQLILTHTHAGISSIKAKLSSSGIPNDRYNVETITSFAQKYVLAFFNGVIPEQSDTAQYYPFIIDKAIELIQIGPVKKVIETTYTGLFVDEYQDCTIRQHNLILALAQILQTRVLGDYLQGIFGFHGEALVNMADPNQMTGFIDNQHVLTEPWRWKINGGNETLGNDLNTIRGLLLASQPIDLRNYSGIEFHLEPEADIYDPRKNYYRELNRLLNEPSPSILVIHPVGNSINPRIRFLRAFSNRLRLIESIDAKDFYQISRQIDLLTPQNVVQDLVQIFEILFVKTSVNVWFNQTGLKNKRDESDRKIIEPLRKLLTDIQTSFSLLLVEKILREVKRLPGVKSYRLDLFHSLCNSIVTAHVESQSVLVSMQNHRNKIRQVGRTVFGKSIGTTLLTKGLEFETVILIDAHKFENKEHLYVALTRASKRLIVFSSSNVLSPY